MPIDNDPASGMAFGRENADDRCRRDGRNKRVEPYRRGLGSGWIERALRPIRGTNSGQLPIRTGSRNHASINILIRSGSMPIISASSAFLAAMARPDVSWAGEPACSRCSTCRTFP